MLFTGPLWLSTLIPILFAPVLLIVSLVAGHWSRTGFDKSVCLSTAGLALALVTGGALFAAVIVGLVLFTHWIALAIERTPDPPTREAPRRSLPARVWLVVAVGVQLTVVAVMSRGGVIIGPLQNIGTTIVPFGVSYFGFHGISYVVDVYRGRAAAKRSRHQLAVYLLLLPLIVGGPLAYEGVASHLARGWPSVSDYSYGVRRLLIGVWKVCVVADLTGKQADVVFALRPSELSAFQAVVGAGQLYAADLLRVLRVFRHGDRARTDTRRAAARKFPLAIRRTDDRRAPELWLVLAAGAIGCAPLVPAIRRSTVVVDALKVSLLMPLFGAVLFAWRCGSMVAAPAVRLWRST